MLCCYSKEALKRYLHNYVFIQKLRDLYVLPICLHEYDENAPENKDLSGDFEN